MITKELKHFYIQGRYGGSQEWMLDPWLRLGGCGALAAVDTCIYFSVLLKKEGRIKMVNEPEKIDKKRYRLLASEMKPYLRPRAGGISRLEIYRDGFGEFLHNKKISGLSMDLYPMGSDAGTAWEVFREQIDSELLVPVLLLMPISREWNDYRWHWFLLNGYKETDEGEKLVKVVTYGAFEWLHWETFWDEENEKNGGMILYRRTEQE